MGPRKIGAAVLVGLCLAGAGCGSGSETDSAGTGAASDGGKTFKVGIVGFSAADQTSEQAIQGFEDEAKKRGYDVTTVDPQGSPDKAVGAIQDMVQKQVDLIVVTVFPTTSLAGGVRAAKAAGIPIVSLSGGTGDGVQVNYDGGESAGRMLADRLIEDTGGKGEMLALGYKSGLPCIGREKALDAALKTAQMSRTRNEVPIPGQVEASTQFTNAWLAKNKDTGDGLTVWGCFDDPALGAIAAIKQRGRDDVKVYGMNGQPAALKAIQAGDMDGTVHIDVYAAGKEMAEKTPTFVEAGVDAAPTDIPIPATLVTPDNVDAFLADHPDALKGL